MAGDSFAWGTVTVSLYKSDQPSSRCALQHPHQLCKRDLARSGDRWHTEFPNMLLGRPVLLYLLLKGDVTRPGLDFIYVHFGFRPYYNHNVGVGVQHHGSTNHAGTLKDLHPYRELVIVESSSIPIVLWHTACLPRKGRPTRSRRNDQPSSNTAYDRRADCTEHGPWRANKNRIQVSWTDRV